MVCHKLENVYERKIIPMTRKGGKKSSSAESSSTLTEEDVRRIVEQSITQGSTKNPMKKFFNQYRLLFDLIAIFSMGWGLSAQLARIDTIVKNDVVTKDDLKELDLVTNKEFSKLSTEVDELDKTIGDIENRLIVAETELSSKAIITAEDVLSDLLAVSIKQNTSSTVKSSMTADTKIGVDNNGKEYMATELVNQTSLLTYNDGEKEAYFLGQFNEKYHWDGYCITNTYYPDGTLYSVCEYTFDDGDRVDYKSLYSLEQNDIWLYTNRVCTPTGNVGISDKFRYESSKQKNFTNTNVRVSDILSTTDIINSDDVTLLSHYNGLTTGGFYNDNTGSAYEVIYNEKGQVQVLYVGCFKNGQFHDKTDKAMEIVYDGYSYFYYKGSFTNGERDGSVSDNDYVTKDQITEILSDIEFDCDLNWISAEKKS